MKRADATFDGVGGLSIFWQAWLPDDAPKAIVVLAHGVSEHSQRYDHVGRALAEAGYALYALDHRGHGRSEGARAVIDRFEHAVADLDTLVDLAAARHSGAAVFLLGHSMGGAVGIGYALRHQEKLAGLVLSGPLAAIEAASGVTRVVARVLTVVAPKLGIYEVAGDAVSRDPEVVRDYESDPLNHHGKLPVRTVSELVGEIATFEGRAGELRLPLLIMHGSEDRLTPVAGSKMIHERAASPDKTFHVEEGLFHEILNEPERDELIARIVAWLDQRIPLASA